MWSWSVNPLNLWTSAIACSLWSGRPLQACLCVAYCVTLFLLLLLLLLRIGSLGEFAMFFTIDVFFKLTLQSFEGCTAISGSLRSSMYIYIYIYVKYCGYQIYISLRLLFASWVLGTRPHDSQIWSWDVETPCISYKIYAFLFSSAHFRKWTTLPQSYWRTLQGASLGAPPLILCSPCLP